MNLLDVIATVAPRAASTMLVWQDHYRSLRQSTVERRKYDAAQRTRLTKNWNATFGSADRELIWDLHTLRNRSRDLLRNNPYAVAGVRNLVAYLVGTGIRARVQHPNKAFARKAQKAFDDIARELKLYQKQKIMVRSMIEGGDCFAFWREDGKVPDARLDILEGEYCDHTQTRETDNGARWVLGVKFDKAGKRVGYAMFTSHPGDVLSMFAGQGLAVPNLLANNVVEVPAEYIDHLAEEVRPGQTRGVPWLAPVAIKLRDIEDMALSIRTKKRIQACLAVFRVPGADDDTQALGERKAASANRPQEDSLRPGMIVTGAPGEEIKTVNPSADGDSDTFYRQEMTSVAAGLGIPAHLMTGDVSQANYTSLRADIVALYQRLDDWQQNTIVPDLCDPWFNRIMRRLYMASGDKRFLECRAMHTPPDRPWVDPYKDGLAEIMLTRAGFKDFAQGCAQRGVDWRDQIDQIAEINAALDAAGIALDIDPRRVNGAGALQPPTGYLAPNEGK
jgi:lambda family phage portal protein